MSLARVNTSRAGRAHAWAGERGGRRRRVRVGPSRARRQAGRLALARRLAAARQEQGRAARRRWRARARARRAAHRHVRADVADEARLLLAHRRREQRVGQAQLRRDHARARVRRRGELGRQRPALRLRAAARARRARAARRLKEQRRRAVARPQQREARRHAHAARARHVAGRGLRVGARRRGGGWSLRGERALCSRTGGSRWRPRHAARRRPWRAVPAAAR